MPALALFAFGLALRVLFVLATPDAGAGWHVGFQGDAPVWQRLAHGIAHGIADDELRLPWRPPGMQWLVALLWNGDPATVWPLRGLMLVLGAAIGPLLWWLLRDRLSAGLALFAATLSTVAGNLLLLASGLHVETVYLPLVLATCFDQRRLAERPSAMVALRWGVAHGALCLLRAEHALTFLALALLLLRAPRRIRTMLLAFAGAAAVLAPWQLHANRLVAAYNAGAPELPPAPLPWDPEAIAALRLLPSFQQVPVHAFVTDTVRVRGGSRVRAADLDIVHEAYGCRPEPLRPAFVAIYGGLNFWLANTPESGGGFSRAALDRPPPLAGGEARYPPGLRRVLPRGGTLALSYPPHLDAVVHGHARGLAELQADPWGSARRVLRKAWHTVEGATGGVGGYALPIGLSGLRRPVDFVTATGWWPASWRVAVLVVAAIGWWRLRREAAVRPLLVFAATRALIGLVWFGYARNGALLVPVVAIGIAAALPAAGRGRRPWVLLASVTVLELVRWATVETPVDALAPSPSDAPEFAARRIEFG